MIPDLTVELPPQRRRWYDKEVGCVRALHLIKEMSHPDLRDVSARLLIHVSDRIQDMLKTQNRNGALSLGLPALQDLYMAKRMSRRWYDEEPMLKKAMGGLYALPNEGLSAVSFKLLDTIELIFIYAYACQRLEQEPTREDLQEMIRVSLYDTPEEAERCLTDIVGKDLYETLLWEISG